MAAKGRGDARARLGALTGWMLVVALASVVTSALARAQGVADATDAAGGTLYQHHCAACHGTQGEGMPGTGLAAGPPLVGLPVALVDLVIRTGRMPIAHDDVGVVEQQLTSEQRERLVAWAAVELELDGEIPVVTRGSAAQGQVLYTLHCAACHGATGSGGVAGDATLVPPIVGLDEVALAEAVRTGPFAMPEFSPALLSEDDVGDIAAFVRLVERSDTTPLGLREISAVAAAVLVALLALLLAGVVLLSAAFGRDDAEADQA